MWAPLARRLEVQLIGERPRCVPLERGPGDVFEGFAEGIGAGADYFVVLDGARARPDPVSRWQPLGVHGPSRVVDPAAHRWSAQDWRGLPLERYIVYELHVGTFTAAGTFAGAIGALDHLCSLGITAVELMPVAEFPGGRNWGYDGVHLFAAQSTYGGPEGLCAFVDACHTRGVAVILDVVLNHVGPEGNYLAELAPFFGKRPTPWGPGFDLDGPASGGVRRHLISSALSWLRDYRIDALRLDAVQAIHDGSRRHLLAELEGAVRGADLGRPAYLIAETDRHDVRVIRPRARGGYALDAKWSDDFHHALRAVLTGDKRGHFADFGRVAQLAEAITDGAVRPHRGGTRAPAARLPGNRFVVYVQNHDQIANASQGRRLSEIVGRRAHALAATLLFATPNVPMLFMGEEYGERAPFLYFVSHSDPALVDAVRRGRRHELGALGAGGELGALLDDPQAEAPFLASKLDWSRLAAPAHAQTLAMYRELIALRRGTPALARCRKDRTRAWWSEAGRWLVVERRDPSARSAVVVCNLSDHDNAIPCGDPDPGTYDLAFATDEPRYGGSASPQACFELQGDPVTLICPGYAARIYLARGSRRAGAGARPRTGKRGERGSFGS